MTKLYGSYQHDDPDILKEALVGRRVVSVSTSSEICEDDHPFSNKAEGELRLDDGTLLVFGGNRGCGGCVAGHYTLTNLKHVNNAIMDVVIDVAPTDDYGPADGSYTIFVLADGLSVGLQELAKFEGTDGNGWYGTGFWFRILPPREEICGHDQES